MIVLAIAGLIMLIVFLVVPALQRASRNTSRKEDASRLATAVSTFVSNSNGDLPCESTGTFASGSGGDAQTVLSDAGKLGQLSFSNGAECSTSAAPATNTFMITDAAPGTAPAAADNEVVVFLGSTCSGTYAVSAGTRQAALVYPLETSGAFTWSCISAL
jgi:hypothetical protein